MAPIAEEKPKPAMNWADDVDEDVQPLSITEKDEGNGIKVITEIRINSEGKKVKITRRIKKTLKTSTVSPQVASRKSLAKFGQEKGKKPGPQSSTTTIGENVQLKMSAGGAKNAEPEVDDVDAMRSKLAGKKITCRLCKGDHFTTKCPYKDTLGAIPGAGESSGIDGADTGLTPANIDSSNPAVAASGITSSGGGGGAGGKYVPPSMRAGASRTGERMGGAGRENRDDAPTLRVTNLSEEAEEDDLRDMFSRFGRVTRVYIGRDRETGVCKGYAFVSFEDKDRADLARQKLDGHGYDNLILSVNWSIPRAPGA